MSRETRKHLGNKKRNTKEMVRLPKQNPFTDELSRQTERTNKQLVEPEGEERPTSLEAMMIDIARRQNEFEQQHITKNETDQFQSDAGEGQEKSRKTFYREFKKVVDASDIIIEVLDARDPLGCRCPQVEEAVLTSGRNKKLILLLNKIDLIPRDNLDKWLKYLRNEFPTIAFRSSTQNQRDRLGHMKLSVKACDEHLLKSSNKCIGASTLMNLLSNYCRRNDIKTSITVGIVGYPNVGKSSVINSLKRSQACETGSMPGITKQMQTIRLDKLIKLFDSPGIVMSKESNSANLVLRNCIRIETIENPIPAVELLLHRCTKQQMILQYNLDDFQDVNDFLSKMAIKLGCLRKGGFPDIHKAAQRVLSDWTNGRLTYFTEPPERNNDIISTELVAQMKEAFDIDNLFNIDDEQLEDLPDSSTSASSTSFAAGFPIDQGERFSDNESSTAEVMDDSPTDYQSTAKSPTKFTVQVRDKTKRRSKQLAADVADKEYNDELRGSVDRFNLTRQQEFKKMKKHQKKTEKSMEHLSNAFDSSVRISSTSITDELDGC